MIDIKKNLSKNLRAYVIITVGVTLSALALNLFLVPRKIAPGGFSGIATILYYLFNFPVGTTIFALNIPLFIIGIIKLGKGFGIRTFYALIIYSLLADILPKYDLAGDTFLASIYGGLLMGIGTGIIIINGATTGGSDMAAKIISAQFKSISVSNAMFVIDFFVIMAAGIVFEVQSALYALVSIYLSTKMVEFFTVGFSRAKAFLIISGKGDEIASFVLHEMNRGVTRLQATGGYSKTPVPALLCMIERRTEIVKLKRAVKQIDPQAFLIMWESSEVLGEGFKPQ